MSERGKASLRVPPTVEVCWRHQLLLCFIVAGTILGRADQWLIKGRQWMMTKAAVEVDSLLHLVVTSLQSAPRLERQ